MAYNMTLPYSQELNIKYLQRLFDNMSECYKPFWFQAIIDKVAEGKQVLSYEELIDDMIADAWYMVLEYKLNLGPADTLEVLVLDAQKVTGLKSSEKKEKIISAIQSTSDRNLQRKKNTLALNVPYRLQAPFLHQLKGKSWNCPLSELAARIDEHEGIIYRFITINGLNSLIKIAPEWITYIRSNYEILCGWIQYNLIQYLQRRNPSVPGIPNKLKPPQERKLTKVQNLWKSIIEIEPMHEIYESSQITPKDMSIDHFVPWSYVAHDELWNLSPTTKSINSQKSNRLPEWDIYFPALRALQYHAYDIAWKYPQVHKEFDKCIKEHVNNSDVLHKLYLPEITESEFYYNLEEIIHPVYVAAQNTGFESWKL